MLFYEYSSKNTGWLKWIDAVETFLGHSLDGDQEVDGYSLDYANLAYTSGYTVLEYVTYFQRNKKIGRNGDTSPSVRKAGTEETKWRDR